MGQLPVWRLADEPEVTIGEVEGEAPYLFNRVSTAARLSDGRIVVADLSSEVRVFDESGSFLLSVGGEGEGPGEFRRAELLSPGLGDSIHVFDRLRQTVTTFAPDGSLGAIQRTAVCPPGPESSPLAAGVCRHAVGLLDDGSVVHATGTKVYTGGLETGFKIGREIAIGVVRDGTWQHLGALHQGNQFWSELGYASGVRPYPQIHGGRIQWAADSDVVAEARNDSTDVRIHSAEGGLVRIIRFTAPRVPVTDEHIDAYRDHDWGDAARTDNAMAWLDESEPSELIPLFGEIRVGETGRLWVEDYYPWTLTPNDAPRWWTVFGRDGTPVARIQMPGIEDLVVFSTGPSHVVGRTTDELDIERIVVYRIEGDGE